MPTTASRKSDIQNWLRFKAIKFEDAMLKVELLAIVNENKKAYNKYIIDEMAKEQRKIVLRLPPYHCELNPIELIWGDVKNSVAKRNTTFKFADMQNLFREALATITAEKWKKCIQHVQQKVETKMWQLDHIIEVHVEPLIINVDEDSSSSSGSSE